MFDDKFVYMLILCVLIFFFNFEYEMRSPKSHLRQGAL